MTALQPWMSLARVNRHPRDACIVFDEPTHVYTVNGSSKGVCSITQFLHHFFPKFDADAIIKKMMASKKWPESKWYGMTPKAIKDAWNANGKEASEAGTAMHLSVEMAMNGAWDEIPASAKDTVEWRYFMKYWDKYKETLEPYRTEWEVWDEELKLAGSIDMVYRRKSDGTLCIYDWKRAKEMKYENNFDSGFGPASHLPDTNYWHYTLQLNMYRWILERRYGVTISEMALIVLHPNNGSYKRILLNRLEEEIEGMVEYRRRALAAGRGIVLFQEVRPAAQAPGPVTSSDTTTMAAFLDD